MRDNEIMCETARRIDRLSGVSHFVTFSFGTGSTIEIFVKGTSHAVFETPEEAFAFLDGIETALEEMRKDRIKM